MSISTSNRLEIDARKKPRIPFTSPQGSRRRAVSLLLLWRMSDSADASFSSMISNPSSASLTLSPESGSLTSGTCDSSGRNVTAGVQVCNAFRPALLEPIGEGWKLDELMGEGWKWDGDTADHGPFVVSSGTNGIALGGHGHGDACCCCCCAADMVVGEGGHGQLGDSRARTRCASRRRRRTRGGRAHEVAACGRLIRFVRARGMHSGPRATRR